MAATALSIARSSQAAHLVRGVMIGILEEDRP